MIFGIILMLISVLMIGVITLFNAPYSRWDSLATSIGVAGCLWFIFATIQYVWVPL